MQLFNSKQSALFFRTVFCTFFFLCLVLACSDRCCLYQNTFGLCSFYLFILSFFFCLGESEEGGGSFGCERILYLNCEPEFS